MRIIAYVIMPEHFHLLVQNDDLSNTLKSIKSFSAREIIKRLEEGSKIEILDKFHINKKSYKRESKYQIWQESFHPQQILSDRIFQQKIDYIHFNPVKRGLVNKPEEWRYSSAAYYYLDREVDLDIYTIRS